DDFRRTKMLKLRRIGAGLGCKVNQGNGPIELAIMIGGDVGDEISRVGVTNDFFADLQSWHRLSNESGDLLRVPGLPDFTEKPDRFFDRSHSPAERSLHLGRIERSVSRTSGFEMRISEARRLNQFFIEVQFSRQHMRELEL